MRRLLIVGIVCAAIPARAEPFWQTAPRASTARRIATADGDTHLAMARVRTLRKSQSLPYGVAPIIWEDARKAVASYERALAAAGPDDAELHWRAMLAAEYVDVRGASNCSACRDMYEATARHAEGFLAADPRDPRGQRASWAACLALSKLGALGGPDAEKHLRRAIQHYVTYRRNLDEGSMNYSADMGLAYANEAELHMAIGELEVAIQYYQQAADLNPAETLNHYGLAVAYDRDGQWGKAYAAMREAVVRDPLLQRFESDSVFFVPDGDILYYKALARHVLGIRDGGDENLGFAVSYYRRFLERERTGRWHARAREHLRELEVRGRQLRPAPRRDIDLEPLE